RPHGGGAPRRALRPGAGRWCGADPDQRPDPRLHRREQGDVVSPPDPRRSRVLPPPVRDRPTPPPRDGDTRPAPPAPPVRPRPAAVDGGPAAAQGRVEILLEALPYIQRFRTAIVVVKYGGSAMV